QAWSKALLEYGGTAASMRSFAYWRSLSEHAVASVPMDHPEGANTIAHLESVSVALNEQETQALLQEAPKVYHTQINDVLLTALVQTFARWTEQQSLYIDLEGHGREDVIGAIDVSRTVGRFTS